MSTLVPEVRSKTEGVNQPLTGESSLHASNPTTSNNATPFLFVEETAEFLGISKQTVYQNVSSIPHYKRHGRLYFKRSELVTYVEEGAVKCQKRGVSHA